MKKRLAIIAMLVFCLTACSNEGKTDADTGSNTQEDSMQGEKQITQLSVAKMQKKDADMQMQEFTIPHEKGTSIGTFAVADGKVYYALSYASYYEDPEGVKADADQKFDPKHNTQIRVFDTAALQDTLIYQYDEGRCVDVSDMMCNGKFLLWEDYGIDSELWGVNAWNLSDASKPERIISASEVDAQFTTITLSVTDEGVYWYDLNESNDACRVYYYDFAKKQSVVYKDGVDTASPYTHVSIVDGVLTTYKYEDGKTKINVEKGTDETSFEIDGYVANVQCNGKICAWMKNEDIRQCTNIFLYDLQEKTYFEIDCGGIFSFNVLQNGVLVNQYDGLYLYDIYSNAYEAFKESDTNYCGYTYLWDDMVYAQVFEAEVDEFSVLIIK